MTRIKTALLRLWLGFLLGVLGSLYTLLILTQVLDEA